MNPPLLNALLVINKCHKISTYCTFTWLQKVDTSSC